MVYQWVDCDRRFISERYNRIATFIPLFDWLLFLPRDLRERAVAALGLKRGDRVADIGCGIGSNFRHRRDAVGPQGHIFGIDISPGMIGRAEKMRAGARWHNIHLIERDAVDFIAPFPLDGVLFSLSYNTMPNHRAVLHRAWDQLRPGGRLIIMDAKLPDGPAGRLLLPFSLWLMKRTLLGNPLVQPWKEVGEIVQPVEMSEWLLGSYYICRAVKPVVDTIRGQPRGRQDPVELLSATQAPPTPSVSLDEMHRAHLPHG